MSSRISLIGGGNMATAIVSGLINSGTPPQNIYVSDPDTEKLSFLKNKFKCKTTSDNNKAILFDTDSAHSDIVILAVKPQLLTIIAKDMKNACQKANPCIISIAAGINLATLNSCFSPNTAVVRCMPNTPALVNEGATALFAGANVNANQKALAEAILKSVSKSIFWVENEHQLDIVTGLSGSGPAYFFLLIESIENAAVELGLPRHIARGLANQTCLGAGKMAVESDVDAAELRRRVTSPNGTTHAAIVSAENDGFRKLWMTAVKKATDRATELGEAKL